MISRDLTANQANSRPSHRPLIELVDRRPRTPTGGLTILIRLPRKASIQGHGASADGASSSSVTSRPGWNDAERRRPHQAETELPLIAFHLEPSTMTPRLLFVLLLGSLMLSVRPDAAFQQNATSVSYPPVAGAGKGRHVVFLAGDEEYRSEEGLPMLAKILSHRHGFKCTVLFSVDPDGTINPEGEQIALGSGGSRYRGCGRLLLRFRAPGLTRTWRASKVSAGRKTNRRVRTSTHAFNGLAMVLWERGIQQPGRLRQARARRTWLTHWGHTVSKRIPRRDSNLDSRTTRSCAASRISTANDMNRPATRRSPARPRPADLAADSPPSTTARPARPDKQQAGVNDPPMPSWTPQQERQRRRS